MEEFENFVEFVDEEGNTIELEILEYFEHDDETYAILADTQGIDEDEESEIDVFVMRVLDDGSFEYPDEDKIGELEVIVNKLFEESEHDCDCDDDDCGCGCGHHHE